MSESFAGREAGFTLLEMIVVMVVLTILSAVTVLSMAFYIPDLRLKAASQDINLQIQRARLEAIRQNSRCYVDFFVTVGGQTFSPYIWLDNNADGIADQVLFRLPVALEDGEWALNDYRGIRFDASFGSADGVTFPLLSAPVKRYQLNSRGISSNSGSIYLRNARGKAKQILVTLGGATRIQ